MQVEDRVLPCLKPSPSPAFLFIFTAQRPLIPAALKLHVCCPFILDTFHSFLGPSSCVHSLFLTFRAMPLTLTFQTHWLAWVPSKALSGLSHTCGILLLFVLVWGVGSWFLRKGSCSAAKIVSFSQSSASAWTSCIAMPGYRDCVF